MIRQLCALLLIAALIGAGSPALTVSTQILDYEHGYLFISSGDAFRVAPNAAIVNGTPAARRYALVTFDSSGAITRIQLADKAFPPEGDVSALTRYAVALSPRVANPDLVPLPNPGRCSTTRAGKSVTVVVTVQVPPSTSMTDTVYMTTDTSGWNAQAYRLDRVDALHYRTVLKLFSGTVMHVLFDRGSTQSIEVGQNGIEMKPYLLCIGDEDAQAFTRTVYRWGDEANGSLQTIPQTLPTPYNPSPFQTPIP